MNVRFFPLIKPAWTEAAAAKAPGFSASEGDFEAVKKISAEIRSRRLPVLLARYRPGIDRCWQALEGRTALAAIETARFRCNARSTVLANGQGTRRWKKS
jgi:hypothetical protein